MNSREEEQFYLFVNYMSTNKTNFHGFIMENHHNTSVFNVALQNYETDKYHCAIVLFAPHDDVNSLVTMMLDHESIIIII